MAWYPQKLLLQKKKSKCTKMGNVENYKLHAQELKNTKKLQPFTTSTEFKKFFKHSKLTWINTIKLLNMC